MRNVAIHRALWLVPLLILLAVSASGHCAEAAAEEKVLQAQSITGGRKPVRSTMIHSAGYDEEQRIFEVQFRGGGVYQYINVPPEVYQQFLAAESKGRFVRVRVRGHYEFRKISEKARE